MEEIDLLDLVSRRTWVRSFSSRFYLSNLPMITEKNSPHHSRANQNVSSFYPLLGA